MGFELVAFVLEEFGALQTVRFQMNRVPAWPIITIERRRRRCGAAIIIESAARPASNGEQSECFGKQGRQRVSNRVAMMVDFSSNNTCDPILFR